MVGGSKALDTWQASLQEALYGKDMVVADREMVELEADRILEGADTEDVAFLVVGDPFGRAPLLFWVPPDRPLQPPKVGLGLSRCALT